MLLLKRIATSIVLFVFFFVVVYFAICIVGGAVNGAMAGAGTDAHDGYDAGAQAGANFVRHNMGVILLSSFVISSVLSLVLSFSGILPWCKKPSQPPPL